MKRKPVIHGLLLGVGLLLLMFLYSRVDNLSLEHFKQGTEYIERLRQNNVAIGKEILAARAGLTSHYDNIVYHQNKTKIIANEIKSLLQSQSPVDHNLIKKIDQYKVALLKQTIPIEDFKSDNSILRNSVHYFPLGVNQLLEKLINENITLFTSVQQQAMDLLVFYTLNDPQLLKSIKQRRQQLEIHIEQLPEPTKKAFSSVQLHENAILYYSQRVNKTVNELINNNHSNLIAEFERDYSKQLQRVQHQVSQDRLYTYFLLSVLMAYASYLLYRIRHMMISLRENNMQLEAEVVRRTQTLSRQNEELSTLDDIAQAINEELQLSEILTILFSRTSRLLGKVSQCYYVEIKENRAAASLIIYHSEDPSSTRAEKCSKEQFETQFLSSAKRISHGVLLKQFPEHNLALPLLNELDKARVMLTIQVDLKKQATGYLLFVNDNNPLAFDNADSDMLHRLREHAITAIDKVLLLETLHKQSTTDVLTGLNNRHFLSEHIDYDINSVNRTYQTYRQSHSYGRPVLSDLIFFMIDIDHFKVINDIHGHNAGDQVLIQCSKLLKNVCRQSSYLIRWGGEEFLLLERFVSLDQAAKQAERLLLAFREHTFEIDNGEKLSLTCSIGFAAYPFLPNEPAQINWEQVVDLADKALYAAKISSRNAWAGFIDSENTISADELLSNPIEAINSDKVNIISSIPSDKSLKWSIEPSN